MSYDNNKNRDEEKVFSVTMTEEELSLFSEFLEQREYARGVVSKMNPRMTRNGRMMPGKSASTKQLRDKSSRDIVNRTRPETEYVSEGWRTVESRKSIDRKKNWEEKYPFLLRNQKQGERTDVGPREIGKSGGTIVRDRKKGRSGIHEVISSKEGIIEGLKENGSKSPDAFQLRMHEGRYISPNVPKDHSNNLSSSQSSSGKSVTLRDFYDKD